MFIKKPFAFSRIMIRILDTILFLASIHTAYSQPLDFLKSDTTDQKKTYPRYLVFDLKIHHGWHITTGVDILEETIEKNPYDVVEFRLGMRGYGNRRWHQLYRYPTYGVGFYQAWFVPQNNQLGNPMAVYMFFNPSLVGNENIAFGIDFEFGVSFNFLNFDPDNNPYQLAIGSATNIHFQLGGETSFRILRSLDGAVGIGLTHFSNGRIRTPQLGINLCHVYGRMRYHLPAWQQKNGIRDTWSRRRPENIRHEFPKFKGRWEYYGVLSAGVATPEVIWVDNDITYLVSSLSLDVARHYYYFGKGGVGIDLFHDRSITEKYRLAKSDVSLADMTYWGFHVSHELMIHRWTVITQMGVMLSKREIKGKWYGRAGLRFDFTRHLFFRGTLKIPDGFKADFIEWGLGYNFYSPKIF